jgi:uncharacterized protein
MIRASRIPRITAGAVVYIACWCFGTAAAQGARQVQSMLEIRQQNVMMQRWDLSCGAAALGTLLRYGFGESVTEKAIAAGLIGREEYVRNPKLVQLREGFSLLDLKRYVQSFRSSSIRPDVFTRSRRRAADRYPATLSSRDQPQGSLASGHRSRGVYKGEGLGQLQLDDLIQRAPIIVPINSNGYNHFVVFRGVVGNRVLLADPAWGNRTVTTDKFQRMWLDYGETIGHVGFVITRADRRKSLNRLEPTMSGVVMLR